LFGEKRKPLNIIKQKDTEYLDKNHLTCISYNVFRGENIKQLKYIKKYDIVILSEASERIDTKLDNYFGYKIKSHCGYTYIGISKKYVNLNTEYHVNITNYAILMGIKNDKINIVIGGVHLQPKRDGKTTRRKQLVELNKSINNITNKTNSDKILIGGDFNMRDDENKNILTQSDFKDVGLNDEHTYPNKNCEKFLDFISPTDFRYDRFYIKGLYYNSFNVKKDMLYSDHYPIEIILKHEVNKKIIKNDILKSFTVSRIK
jgi:endonuclease/exonuclease/phosphatase (EEP) superfamily protein YafD